MKRFLKETGCFLLFAVGLIAVHALALILMLRLDAWAPWAAN